MSVRGYVYWPTGLVRQCKLSDEPLVVLVLRTSTSDPLVIAVIEESSYEAVEKPYSEFGRVRSGNVNLVENSPQWRGDYTPVFFDPPKLNMMQFYSLEPISLVLQDPFKDSGIDSIESSVIDDDETSILKLREKCNSKLRQNIDHLNLYYQHLEIFYKRYPIYKSKSPLNISVTGLKLWIRTSNPYRAIRCMAFYLAVLIRVVAGALSQFLNWKLLPLVKLFATAQQIDLRCQQVCYIPLQYLRINKNMILPDAEPRIDEKDDINPNGSSSGLRQRRKSHSVLPKALPCETYPDYIRLYNTLWLIINDVSFGASLGGILYENRIVMAQNISTSLSYLLYEIPVRITEILEHNPLGIKLNDELSRFLSSLFLLIIEFTYTGWIRPCIQPETLTQGIIVLSHISTLIGLTFPLALAVDFLSIMTLHITLFYMISAKVYHVHIYVMKSLFYLFYGKKQNRLRKRIDDTHFELDQLLMGTLIFTVLIFLLPTLFSFYLVYTVFRLIDLTLKVSLELTLALVNHFPLFALLLRIKDAKRLPGGIKLKVEDDHLVIMNNPISFLMMFEPFTTVLRSMQREMLSVATLKMIAQGSVIQVQRNKLYRVLYYNLPRYPIDVELLWEKLKMVMEKDVI
ncbi:unnamed protein product [Kluyveromyces dobzhanskii CBS 2104]|uniref:WGS project CCBQ000000000 data, contig 00046 n=1 Tax=Kluyveromyces dobzhanskii CBS 2104 TaxID=1427455 RepID=A0A0A8L9A5_9SACH|nr:unnamed protein product [Kluyveromyces dobzhanskii CBS 2104]